MLRAYEAGQIVGLENCGFQWDFDLFERVEITRHADKLVNYHISKLSMTDSPSDLLRTQDGVDAVLHSTEQANRTGDLNAGLCRATATRQCCRIELMSRPTACSLAFAVCSRRFGVGISPLP